MEATEGGDADAAGDPADERSTVTALRASPDRTVFTEEANVDGWIATDLTVEPER
jgi:hypothetical protein